MVLKDSCILLLKCKGINETVKMMLLSFLLLANSILAENNVCSLTQGVTITASSAGNVRNEFSIAFGPQWQAIGTYNPRMLESLVNSPDLDISVSSVSWFEFPIITCDFLGVDSLPILRNARETEFEVTFPISPPQVLIAA